MINQYVVLGLKGVSLGLTSTINDIIMHEEAHAKLKFLHSSVLYLILSLHVMTGSSFTNALKFQSLKVNDVLVLWFLLRHYHK